MEDELEVDDPFTFKKKAFIRQKEHNSVESESESGSDSGSNSESSDEEDERKALKQSKATKRKVFGKDDASDTEEDSDSEIEVIVQDTKKAKKPNNQTLVIFDSSDDDDDSNSYTHSYTQQKQCSKYTTRSATKQLNDFNPQNKQSFDLLVRSRQARHRLHSAQQYKAEDISAPVTQSNQTDFTPSAFRNNLGPEILLKLRVQQFCDGNPHTALQEYLQPIRKLEPIIKLVNRFIKSIQIPEDHKIQIFIKDHLVQPTKTPATYGLQHNHVLDLHIHYRTKRNSAPLLKLIFRTSQSNSHQIMCQKNQNFGSIIQQYRNQNNLPNNNKIQCKLDGDILTPDVTPEHLDLEDSDLIDVIIT